jgi:peptide/nickel transport system ATP-binding protein
MPDTPILQADQLALRLPDRAARRLFRATPHIDILRGIDLSLQRGETLGIVGESGSGKTSLGRTLVRLYEPTGGVLRFEGADITHLGAAALRAKRERLQMIFQDPQSSLNPRHTVGRILTQPLAAFGHDATPKHAAALLERVGLPTGFAARYPHQLSGGQRQRVGIARAIALRPAVVVADEIVSGLDVSSQAIILTLLADLKRELGLSLVFISHDLSVIRVLCDRVLVLLGGEVVECNGTEALFSGSTQPYTRRLIEAIPLPEVDPAWLDERKQDVLF